MTPADHRVAELIDRWIASIDAHLRYTELSDREYAQVQAWPPHDRPTKWVLEVAKQKVLELKTQCEARRGMGDSKFAESLELMAFLSNLVGLQHIQRFIPLATPNAVAPDSTVEAKRPTKPARADDSTREMPKLKVSPQIPAKPQQAPTPKAAAKPEPKKGIASKGGPAPVSLTPQLQAKIVADAIRLLKWGKEWHELADLIARIAERPPAGEIRKVLRTHKAEIESKARK